MQILILPFIQLAPISLKSISEQVDRSVGLSATLLLINLNALKILRHTYFVLFSLLAATSSSRSGSVCPSACKAFHQISFMSVNKINNGLVGSHRVKWVQVGHLGSSGVERGSSGVKLFKFVHVG
jgi:hypothetical protein